MARGERGLRRATTPEWQAPRRTMREWTCATAMPALAVKSQTRPDIPLSCGRIRIPPPERQTPYVFSALPTNCGIVPPLVAGHADFWSAAGSEAPRRFGFGARAGVQKLPGRLSKRSEDGCR